MYNNILRNSRMFSTCLDKIGITQPKTIYHNLSYPELLNHELKNDEGKLLNTKYGHVFSVNTGKFTGRSPSDKWIVRNKDSESDKNIWWGNINQETTPEVFNDIFNMAIDHFNTLESCYVFDGYCGTHKSTQKHVRFIHELSWQQHFVSNMFIKPSSIDELKNAEPDFTIINACSEINKKWKEHNLNSDVAIIFNIEKKIAVILGTWYGGENKKGIFSLMNYWLPLEKIMSMHCSANIGKNNDVALFFGLSGTGKTTLSVDPNRELIGDDEHGWDDDGIFNFEGGCYAKTINLSEENEPDIYQAIKTNALLENVYANDNNIPYYDNTTITENGRVSYPLDHIKNHYKKSISPHPNNIIFLTCDAFGILPPVSILSHKQAMYHFISGYTAKIAGTERGISEPQATFSACFGEAFLTLHPIQYAELFEEKLKKYNCNTYLVNTGWTGGPYGIGNRISIRQTRECIDSILDGRINNYRLRSDPIFNFKVPIIMDNIPEHICDPRKSWDSRHTYDAHAYKLASMFQNNYKKYIRNDIKDYSNYGPIISSYI